MQAYKKKQSLLNAVRSLYKKEPTEELEAKMEKLKREIKHIKTSDDFIADQNEENKVNVIMGILKYQVEGDIELDDKIIKISISKKCKKEPE